MASIHMFDFMFSFCFVLCPEDPVCHQYASRAISLLAGKSAKKEASARSHNSYLGSPAG